MNKIITNNIKFLLFIYVFLLFYFSPAVVSAKEISLTISPPIIPIITDPGKSATAELTVSNKSTEPVTLRIQLKEFSPSKDADGSVSYNSLQNKQSPVTSIFPYVQILDNDNQIDTLSLGPQQEKILTLAINIPVNQNISDYYFSIFFISEPPEDELSNDQNAVTANSKLSLGIASHILLSVGSSNTKGVLDVFTGESFILQDPETFTIKVNNTGAHAIVPHGNIIIKNILNQTVASIPVEMGYVLSNSSRTTRLSWPTSFMLGVYTATVNLSISENGPIFMQSFVFMKASLTTIGTLIIICILLLFLTYRMKRNT